jgi:hypothetical protein
MQSCRECRKFAEVESRSHPAFEANAVEGITKIIFKPGRVRGTPVRQLVTQSIRFVLGGGR